MSPAGEVEVAVGATVSRETLERLHSMRPREARDAIRGMFPGSPLAGMRPRDVAGAVSEAHLRIRLRDTLASPLMDQGMGLCGRGGLGPGAKPAPLNSLKGDLARVLSRGSVDWCPAHMLATGRAGEPQRRRVTRRVTRKKPRATGGRTLFGMPWLQAVGILFGIAASVAVVAGAAVPLFR